jgi:HEAT repeat protein
LHSKNENLRHAAVFAFGHLKEKAGFESISELFVIAHNESDQRRSDAIGALRRIVPQSAELRQLAIRILQSGEYGVGAPDIAKGAVRETAIACLEAFSDRESMEALLTALLDEDAHDDGGLYDNLGYAERALGRISLDASQALAPLLTALEVVMEREDKSREVSAARAIAFKATTEERVAPPQYSWSAPNVLTVILRLLGRLGAGARPAIPQIEACLARPYVAGARDAQQLREILQTIENG